MRMIIKIMLDVRHFLFIMIILCLGFAMAFSVAIPAYNPLAWLLWMINTGVYGYSEVSFAFSSVFRSHHHRCVCCCHTYARTRSSVVVRSHHHRRVLLLHTHARIIKSRNNEG